MIVIGVLARIPIASLLGVFFTKREGRFAGPQKGEESKDIASLGGGRSTILVVKS